MYSDHNSLKVDSVAFDVFFVLGIPKGDTENIEKDTIEITKESLKFGDIILIDIEETYHNCFYKGLNWKTLFHSFNKFFDVDSYKTWML